MAKLTYRNVRPGDIEHLAENMRQEDIDEVLAAGQRTPRESLIVAVRRSSKDVFIAADSNDVAIFIGGVSPKILLSSTGIVWLLGTDQNYKYRRNLLKDSRRAIGIFLEMYKRLENYVHVKNTISIRWVKILGFTMEKPVRFPSGEYFMKFYIERGGHV